MLLLAENNLRLTWGQMNAILFTHLDSDSEWQVLRNNSNADCIAWSK